MEYVMNETIAVVTGIIIDFQRANTTMQSIAKERSISMFKRYSVDALNIEGGSFQAVLKDPQIAIRMTLELRSMLRQLTHAQHPKGLDARTSVGLGDIAHGDVLTPNESIAWVRSASGFEELTSRNGRLGVSTSNYDNDALIGATMRLLDRVVAGWSASQASAMEYAIQGLTQHQIAEILNITQPSVNNRLKLAHWNEIEHIIDVWESFVMQRSDTVYIY